jgi:hypothetical protein
MNPAIRLALVFVVCAASSIAFAQSSRVRVVSEDETLKGHTSLAVGVNVSGGRKLDPETFRTAIEQKLRDNGITIRPSGYPELQLNVNTIATDPAPYTVYVLSLECIQTLPLAVTRAGEVAAVATWTRRIYGVVQRLDNDPLGRTVRQLMAEFIGSYLTANPSLAKSTLITPSAIRVVHNRAGFGSFLDGNPEHEQLAVRQLEMLIDSKQQIIQCDYKTSEGRVGWGFWYKTPPANIAEILATWPGSGSHPFAAYGVNAIESCPPAPELALKIRDGMKK